VIDIVASEEVKRMANMLTGIISITISAVILANVYIVTIKETNTSQFTSAESAMWGLLTLIGIVGLVYGVLSIFGLA